MSGAETPPCGCCEGTTRQTPAAIWNRPGLSQVAYRAGTHASFKASLLSALSDPDRPGLAPLATREDGDFTIGLLDAFAVSADILTFYQERLANESYLRTAVQQRSVFELARLVGYVPSPGVAGAAPLAFLLNDAPGSPDPVEIPAGTRVQSIPAPGEQAATFETSRPLTARIAHGAMPAVTDDPVDWTRVTTSLWLEGTATGLVPGDAILLVDSARVSDPASTMWEFRGVSAVQADAANNRTRVEWNIPLAAGFKSAAGIVQLYALRKRASLYGVNAPDPSILPRTIPNLPPIGQDWKYTSSTQQVVLDAVYPAIVPVDGTPAEFASKPERFAWIVLSVGTTRRVYRVTGAADTSPRKYTLTSKATAVDLDTDASRAWFVMASRSTTAYVQSEPLPIARQPLRTWTGEGTPAPGAPAPVGDKTLRILGGGQLIAGQTVAVSGKRVRLRLGADSTATLVGADGRTPIPAAEGDVFLLDAYPPDRPAAGRRAWRVVTTKGVAGTLTTAATGAVELLPADKADAEVTEAAVLDAVAPRADETTLTFDAPLARLYDRATVRVNANVVPATHGETVKEILGGANAATPNQTFALKQGPLTYLAIQSGQGAQSTLEVWVNDLRWQERENLLDAGPRDRVFVTRRREDGAVLVQFGDGTKGARPPTGQMNVRATYRKGLGRAGLVAAGQLSQPIDRPGGLKGAFNPAPGSGGADPDTPEAARRSAPLHVLTLGRVVSLRDYQDYATAFAGVGRALATWTWFNRTRGIVLTVTGPNGVVLPADGQTIPNLSAGLRSVGNPYVPVTVLPHRPRTFRAEGLVRVDEAGFDPTLVLAACRDALAAAFGFAARALGQGVARSEVVAVVQRVPGVAAVQLTRLTRDDIATVLPDQLPAAAPQVGARGAVEGAELLLIDPLSLTTLERWP